MIEEPERRRWRRRRRGGGASSAPSVAVQPGGLFREGEWRTFPVVLAFVLGILLMGIFAFTPLAFPVFVIGLFGLGLCLSHFALRALVARRRR